MRFKTMKKVLSVALSVAICGCLMLPVMVSPVAAADKVIKVACVGDSITAGSQASSSTYYYPTQLQKILGAGYDVKNFGVSGHTLMSSGDNPYVNNNQYTNSKNFAPDYVIIMLGTNDSKPQNWTHKADFEDDMKAMIQSYRDLASKPTVIVATSPTVAGDGIGITEAVVTDEIVPLQWKVAAEMGCPVIDINSLTKNMPEKYADGIHPNDAGYAALAQMMADGLDGVMNAKITGFSVNGVAATIDQEKATINLSLPKGSDLTAITPEVEMADGSKLDKTGTQNFTDPVTYTVTSPDGKTTKAYTVTVKAVDKIKIACIGDSVTVGVGNTGGKSYPEQLQALLGSAYEVKNFGNSGKTVQDAGTDQVNTSEVCGFRHTDTYKNSLKYDADYVIFMMGGNDSKTVNWKDGDNDFEKDLRALLTDYVNMESKPQVIVGTTLAAIKDSFTLSGKVIEEEIVPIVKMVAKDMGLPLVDVFDVTKDLNEDYFIADGVHYNDTGYAVVAEIYSWFFSEMITEAQGFAVDTGANRADVQGDIDNDYNTIYAMVSASTDITKLNPVLTLPEGATYSPVGVQDFTNPVKYTVTAADGVSTREYTVFIEKQKKLKIACVGDSMTQAVQYPTYLQQFLGTDYEVKSFGRNSTTAQKDGLKENGASPNSGAYVNSDQYQPSLNYQPDIVLLILGANDSKQGVGTQSGHTLVTNWKADSPVNYKRDLKELAQTYMNLDSKPQVILGTSPSGYETAGNWGAKPEIVNNQIAPLQREVAAELGLPLVDFNALTYGKETQLISGDGLHPNGNGYYLLAAEFYKAVNAARAQIDSFDIGDAKGVIDQFEKTIYVTVPDGTDLTALTPTVKLSAHSDRAVMDKTGEQNFGNPVVYTVTNANGYSVAYTVSVTSPSGVSVGKITLATKPQKLSYLIGQDLNLFGATLEAIYTDGKRETVDVTDDMVTGFDKNKVGRQILTVTYQGKTTTLTVQVEPHGVVGKFTAMSGKFTVLGNGQNLMYADWKWGDGLTTSTGFDCSGDAANGSNSNLSLELDITFGSENPDINPADMWNWLVIKLRSVDKAGVAGDPETNNSEHNYGWQIQASAFEDTKTVHISIPLDSAYQNKKGVMDWSKVGRIIIQGGLKSGYTTNSIQHYMDISNVYIVDNSADPSAPDPSFLQADVEKAEAIDLSKYTPETVEPFEAALKAAKDILAKEDATQVEIDRAQRELAEAVKGLKTIVKEDSKNEITFSESNGTITDLLYGTMFYTDWKIADDLVGTGYDVSGNAANGASNLLALKANLKYNAVDGFEGKPNDVWQHIIFRLRSSAVDGQEQATGLQTLYPTDVVEKADGSYDVVIPLSAFNADKINWEDVRELNIFSQVKADYSQAAEGDRPQSKSVTMTLSNVRIELTETKPIDPPVPPVDPVVYGDVNNNGAVTAEDALLALQMATNKITADEAQTKAANVDGNEAITANDALLILQYATKKINSFPVEKTDTPDNGDGGIGSGDGVDDTLQGD